MCIISESVAKSCSPKFQVPSMCYRLNFFAPNFKYQICVIGDPKFDQYVSAYISVKPDCLIEELFYLT